MKLHLKSKIKNFKPPQNKFNIENAIKNLKENRSWHRTSFTIRRPRGKKSYYIWKATLTYGFKRATLYDCETEHSTGYAIDRNNLIKNCYFLTKDNEWKKLNSI